MPVVESDDLGNILPFLTAYSMNVSFQGFPIPLFAKSQSGYIFAILLCLSSFSGQRPVAARGAHPVGLFLDNPGLASFPRYEQVVALLAKPDRAKLQSVAHRDFARKSHEPPRAFPVPGRQALPCVFKQLLHPIGSNFIFPAGRFFQLGFHRCRSPGRTCFWYFFKARPQSSRRVKTLPLVRSIS